jgi:Tol biopolymer transport system component/DNA-binding winged helix-turn-helix (wHTH) protein
LYDFGPYRLDLSRRVFTREGQVIPVAPKTFELLRLLVESAGRALSKQELMAALWPDTFVEEANLSFQISVLRKALGDDAVQWIETVPKYGYRFTAEVKAIALAGDTPAASAEVASLPMSAEVRTRWTGATWLVAVGAASLIAIVFYVAGFSRTPAAKPPAAAGIAIPLTSYPGMEGTPSLSTDGSQVAFSWNGETGDNFDIYVKLVGPGQPWRLTTNPARDEQPSWSPDGRFIAFNRYVTESTADLMVIPALGGGGERRLTTIEVMPATLPLMGALAWTPDGRWVVFSGRPSEDKPYGIWLTAIDHPETRLLTANPGSPVESSDFSPALSQDGRRLAFIRVTTVSQNAVYVLPLSAELTATSPPSRVTRAYSGFLGVAWTPDGSGLLLSSGGHLGLSRLRRIPLGPTRLEPSGEPELLPFGEHATAITISKTGRVVYAAQYRDSNLRKLDLSTAASGPDPSPVASSTFDEQTPDYSPDGTRLAFASTRLGVQDIWVSNADGSNATQVTFTGGPQCSIPRWSPDGRMILFNSRREGTADLYMLDPRSLETRRITSDPTEEIEPRWSRDGRWIYFGSNRTGRYEIWKIRAEGGEAVRITRNGGLAAIESPDGRWLYYAKDFHSPSSIWRVPVGGGAETLVVHGLSYSLNFVVADRGLYFIAVGDTPEKTSLDFFDYRTGKRSILLVLGKRFWYGMALSPDQRTMLYSVVDDAGSNLMVVDGFK